MINKKLAEERNLSPKAIKTINSLHEEKQEIYDRMYHIDDVEELRTCARVLTQIEFELQEAWGFEKDKKYHAFWDVPKCTCPKIDNYERRGSKYSIIDSTCLIHGNTNLKE